MIEMAERFRRVRSVRVDPFLWDDFKEWCKNKDTSTCEMIEGLIFAIMKGTEKLDPGRLLGPKVTVDTMNFTLARQVQKPKRLQKVDAGSPLWQDHGGLFSCFKCHRESKYLVFYHVAPDLAERYYCCGYHVKQFRRLKTGKLYPTVGFRELYG